MQLLSIIDTKKAVSQVATIRQRTTAELPPELPPAEVVRLLKPSVTSTDLTGPASAASEHRKGSIKAAISGSATEDNSLYTMYGIGAEDLKKYGLIALCLLGTNLLVCLVLLVIVVFNWVRRGSARLGGGRGGRPRFVGVPTLYAPVKSQEDGSDSAAYPTRYGDFQ